MCAASGRTCWASKDVKAEPLRNNRMGGLAFFLRDPEGNRLEFWAESGVNEEAGIPGHV